MTTKSSLPAGATAGSSPSATSGRARLIFMACAGFGPLVGSLATIVIEHGNDRGWWQANTLEVQGLAAVGTLFVTTVLVVVTARYVHLTGRLATGAELQIGELQRANEVAKESNRIANQALRDERHASQAQLQEAIIARMDSVTPQVTVHYLEAGWSESYDSNAGVGRPVQPGRLLLASPPAGLFALSLRFEVVNYGPNPAVLTATWSNGGVRVNSDSRFWPRADIVVPTRESVELRLNLVNLFEEFWFWQMTPDARVAVNFVSRSAVGGAIDTHRWENLFKGIVTDSTHWILLDDPYPFGVSSLAHVDRSYSTDHIDAR